MTDLFREVPPASAGPDTAQDAGPGVPAQREPGRPEGDRAGPERLVTPGGYVVEPRPSPAHLALPPSAARLRAAAIVATGLALVVGLVIATRGTGPASDAPAADPTAVPAAPAVPVAAPAAPGTSSGDQQDPPATLKATDVALPTVGVRSTLVGLDVRPDGALQAPADPAVAGWYVRGAAPGEPGPTVIAGHVDSRSGPAVFYRLDELKPGDRVEVTRSDGQVFAYRVATVEQHPKNDFPTARVYGPTPGPELRLITCGGDFDRHSRHYRDNVVVTAIPAG
jgi:LPXTG-site transpeptidase (sortase) family protein